MGWLQDLIRTVAAEKDEFTTEDVIRRAMDEGYAVNDSTVSGTLKRMSQGNGRELDTKGRTGGGYSEGRSRWLWGRRSDDED